MIFLLSIRALFFYSPECSACVEVKENFLPPVIKKYHLEVEYLPVDTPENMQLLMEIEKEFQDYDNSLPVMVIGNHILGNEREIAQKLVPLLERGVEETGWRKGKRERYVLEHEVHAAYFYNPRCAECDRFEHGLRYYERTYKGFRVHRYNLYEGDNMALLEAIEDSIGVPEKERLLVPVLIVDKFYLFELKGDTLGKILEFLGKKGASPFWKRLEKGEESIIERFKTFGVLGVAFAGLLDGLNPCAFATIIFLVTYLSIRGRRREELLSCGAFFILAVFITYFLIGVFLFRIIHFLSSMKIASIIFYRILGAGTLVLAALSLRDFYLAKSGRVEDMVLKLPEAMREKAKESIRRYGKAGVILPSFLMGFFVSLFEFSCTGQVYFPTIAYVSSTPGLRTRAIFFLLVYNLCFILPLVFVFLLAYAGTTQERMNSLLKRNVVPVKFLTFLLFLFFGIYLLFYGS